MSGIDLAAALEAVRLGEATGEHAAVLAAEVTRLFRVDARALARRMEGLVAVHDDRDAARAELATVRAERDAALDEQRRAVARLAEVSAERDRLRAVVVAQTEAADAWEASRAPHPMTWATAQRHSAAHSVWFESTHATEALGRELRGGGR